MQRLALYTIGLLSHPLGSPETAAYEALTVDLYDRLAAVEGFVMLVEDVHDVRPEFAREAGVLPVATLSVWSGLDAAFGFSYRGIHGSAMRRRREWFVRPAQPTHVAWWIDEGHVPRGEEAVARYRLLQDRGATPGAFRFGSAFDAEGRPVRPRLTVRDGDREGDLPD